MNACRACGSLSNFCTAHKFTQHAISTVCDMSTSKIKQSRQRRACTTKSIFPHNFPCWLKFFDFRSPQILCLAIFQLLFSVYSSEMGFISWVTSPGFFFFKIFSLFSFQIQHILKSFLFFLRNTKRKSRLFSSKLDVNDLKLLSSELNSIISSFYEKICTHKKSPKVFLIRKNNMEKEENQKSRTKALEIK